MVAVLFDMDGVLVDSPHEEAWREGVVLCGLSAGSLCWYEAGKTDSFHGGSQPGRGRGRGGSGAGLGRHRPRT